MTMHNDFYSDFKALAYTYRHKLYSYSCSYFSSNFRFLSILPWRPTSGKCKNHLGSLKQMHIAYGICFSYFLICLPHCLKSDLLCVLGSKTEYKSRTTKLLGNKSKEIVNVLVSFRRCSLMEQRLDCVA